MRGSREGCVRNIQLALKPWEHIPQNCCSASALAVSFHPTLDHTLRIGVGIGKMERKTDKLVGEVRRSTGTALRVR